MSAATRIVVADDDADIRELVTLKLAAAGYAVTSGLRRPCGARGHPTRAAAPGRARRPHARDDRRGGVPGATRWGPTERLPIILLTARVQESDIEDGYSAGADDYVSKPFSPRELAVRVRTVLQRVAP